MTMREFRNLDRYLNILIDDDYGQVPDKGHTSMLRDVFQKWIPRMPSIKSVLDIGCGSVAIAEPFFKNLGIEYTGITLGIEALTAQSRGRNVLNMDMSFLDFPDGSFDLIWARHVAEHSPMPLLTLFEWNRVCKDFLCLIVPNPEVYGRTGKQHYSVLYADQWMFLLQRAGFGVIWTDESETSEFRFMAEKKNK